MPGPLLVAGGVAAAGYLAKKREERLGPGRRAPQSAIGQQADRAIAGMASAWDAASAAAVAIVARVHGTHEGKKDEVRILQQLCAEHGVSARGGARALAAALTGRLGWSAEFIQQEVQRRLRLERSAEENVRNRCRMAEERAREEAEATSRGRAVGGAAGLFGNSSGGGDGRGPVQRKPMGGMGSGGAASLFG